MSIVSTPFSALVEQKSCQSGFVNLKHIFAAGLTLTAFSVSAYLVARYVQNCQEKERSSKKSEGLESKELCFDNISNDNYNLKQRREEELETVNEPNADRSDEAGNITDEIYHLRHTKQEKEIQNLIRDWFSNLFTWYSRKSALLIEKNETSRHQSRLHEWLSKISAIDKFIKKSLCHVISNMSLSGQKKKFHEFDEAFVDENCNELFAVASEPRLFSRKVTSTIIHGNCIENETAVDLSNLEVKNTLLELRKCDKETCSEWESINSNNCNDYNDDDKYSDARYRLISTSASNSKNYSSHHIKREQTHRELTSPQRRCNPADVDNYVNTDVSWTTTIITRTKVLGIVHALIRKINKAKRKDVNNNCQLNVDEDEVNDDEDEDEDEDDEITNSDTTDVSLNYHIASNMERETYDELMEVFSQYQIHDASLSELTEEGNYSTLLEVLTKVAEYLDISNEREKLRERRAYLHLTKNTYDADNELYEFILPSTESEYDSKAQKVNKILTLSENKSNNVTVNNINDNNVNNDSSNKEVSHLADRAINDDNNNLSDVLTNEAIHINKSSSPLFNQANQMEKGELVATQSEGVHSTINLRRSLRKHEMEMTESQAISLYKYNDKSIPNCLYNKNNNVESKHVNIFDSDSELSEHGWGASNVSHSGALEGYERYKELQNDQEDADFMTYLEQNDAAERFYSRDEIRLRRRDPANRMHVVSEQTDLFEGIRGSTTLTDSIDAKRQIADIMSKLGIHINDQEMYTEIKNTGHNENEEHDFSRHLVHQVMGENINEEEFNENEEYPTNQHTIEQEYVTRAEESVIQRYTQGNTKSINNNNDKLKKSFVTSNWYHPSDLEEEEEEEDNDDNMIDDHYKKLYLRQRKDYDDLRQRRQELMELNGSEVSENYLEELESDYEHKESNEQWESELQQELENYLKENEYEEEEEEWEEEEEREEQLSEEDMWTLEEKLAFEEDLMLHIKNLAHQWKVNDTMGQKELDWANAARERRHTAAVNSEKMPKEASELHNSLLMNSRSGCCSEHELNEEKEHTFNEDTQNEKQTNRKYNQNSRQHESELHDNITNSTELVNDEWEDVSSTDSISDELYSNNTNQ